jgi:hypothetical protein
VRERFVAQVIDGKVPDVAAAPAGVPAGTGSIELF